MILPINNRDVRVRVVELLAKSKSAKSRAEHHDMLAVRVHDNSILTFRTENQTHNPTVRGVSD
jgi:hypothetical protein